MQKITVNDIKKAIISDGNFRELFSEYSKEINEVLNNPNCNCTIGLIKKIAKHSDKLSKYFPNKDVNSLEEVNNFSNRWSVISTTIDKLEEELNKLHKTGRKQVAIARWQDEITVVINDLNV